jgi:hypothetical protein
MTDIRSLRDELEFYVRDNASHDFAPDIGAGVFDRIDAFLRRFISYPDEHARHAHALWIGHTWLMECWQATPRLLFISPEAASGKTRALWTTKHLVPFPDGGVDEPPSGEVTPAYMFHAIDEAMNNRGDDAPGRPTLVLDELDTVFGPEAAGGLDKQRMRRIINQGHHRDATFSQKARRGTKRYPVYAAMALGGKLALHEVPGTIRTRSIIVRMQRRDPATEPLERWNHRVHPGEAAALRDLLELWTEFVYAHAETYLPERPAGIEDRDADVWEPLLAVADLAGGRWPELARVTAVTAVTALGVKTEPGEGMLLLWQIKAIFEAQKTDRLLTRDLLAKLQKSGQFQWAAPTQQAAIKMSKLLSDYGVAVPTTLRVGAERGKGYEIGVFAEAWRRYPPPPDDKEDDNEQPVTTVTAVTAEEGSDD